MTETTEPKIYLTEEQWEFLKAQEIRRTEAANQVLRDTVRHLVEQTELMRLQETRRMEEKRDYFAAQVIGHLAVLENRNSRITDALIAYEMADAMIEVRDAS